MDYSADIHHRRSIRLKRHDYSEPGAYFITLCTDQRSYLFGTIINGEMQLNDYGAIAADCWHQIPQHFPHVALSAFVVMPNHIHGIIVVTRRGTAMPCPPPDDRAHPPNPIGESIAGSPKFQPDRQPNRQPDRQPDRLEEGTAMPCPYYERKFGESIAGSIPTIVGSYKSAVTKKINLLRHAPGTPVWQRNYYDRIIRDEQALITIQNYIVNNPRSWMTDRFRRC